MKTKAFVMLLVLTSCLLGPGPVTRAAEKSLIDIISAAKPSIVRILYEIKPGDQALLQFYSGGKKIEQPIRALSGSGFIVNKQGYVLTNYHVAFPLGRTPTIFVRIPGEGDFPAKVEKTDRERNLILLVIQKFDGQPVVLGDSVLGTNLKEGQDLLAIGYPFAAKASETTDKEPSATKGIISAFKQTAQEATLIQTDASINEGTSGGPVFNNEGHVIGVVFAGVGKNTNIKDTYNFIFGGKEVLPPSNISFVIPIDHAKHMLQAARMDWLKPQPLPVKQPDPLPEKPKWFASPQLYIPVAVIVLLGLAGLIYVDYAKKKKAAVARIPSRERTGSAAQTQPLSPPTSARTTIVAAVGTIKCTSGELAGQTFNVSERGISIGRGSPNEIQLTTDVVSRRQTWIGPVAGAVVIKDLGSTNGTFVNDQQVTGEQPLRSGDTIRISKNGQEVFTFSS